MFQSYKDEMVNTVISVEEYTENAYFFFTTKHGFPRRTSLSQFTNIRKSGLIALNLREGDELISVRKTDGLKDIMIATRYGYLIRFPEDEVRPMGRTASGVRGISLRDN